MRAILKSIKYSFLLFLFSCIVSCDENKFLEEVPLDFYSPENSYVTIENYQSALTDLYARVRLIHFSTNDFSYVHFLGTDVAFHARGTSDRIGDYNVWMVPTKDLVKYHWNAWYKVVANANTVLSRIGDSELTNEQKAVVSAEAKFFRAFAYRYLVYLYGGVPLLLEEVAQPKTDLVRASKNDVLEQMVSDFSEAADNLPSISEVADGKVSKLVAGHYLAETYIALQKYDEAISAATIVVNDPNVALMTQRFGRRVSETGENVFWDLFQRENQNRGSGNKEALWVCQMEPDIVGGFLSSTERTGNIFERYVVPAGVTQDPAKKTAMLGKAISDYNIGGRGVSIIQPTEYWTTTIWASDFNNDMRNAPHNIVRDLIYNNPASAYYGKSAITNPSPNWVSQPWRWYPWPTKVTTPGDHPEGIYEDKENKYLLTTAGSTYHDMYMLRLPEVYLLRAEAYLAKNDKANAAKDINVVRNRATANPVNASDVTLDYILDERARELIFEEQRRITLSRTGTLVARVRKYNPLNADEIQDFHNLWPIPYAEIEANTDAVLEQNPGYN